MPNLYVYGRCCAKLWQVLWPLRYVDKHYVLSTLADVMPDVAGGVASAVRQEYFNFSSEVLKRTSSNICGRLYSSYFLLRDRAVRSMVLQWSNTEEGALICSLNLSPNVLKDSPIYTS